MICMVNNTAKLYLYHALKNTADEEPGKPLPIPFFPAGHIPWKFLDVNNDL